MITVKLEAIGDNLAAFAKMTRGCGALALKARQPWVARITGPDERFGLRREFVRPAKDYTLANSVGSRRVWLYFHLRAGLYEVRELTGWHSERRYFIRVTGDSSTELTAEEARCA